MTYACFSSCVSFIYLSFFKFPPLPAKAQVNVSAKALKQLGECSTFIHTQSEQILKYLSDTLKSFSLPRLLCRFPWFRGVAAVLSSPGNLPQAGRHTQHPQQKRRRGDLSHQRRREETASFTQLFLRRTLVTKTKKEHKATTEEPRAILMSVIFNC